ncbi:hypothetical protein N7457_007894 [Penicillium paradoxum]|uniref:uncharacterized protein n=1 Tax=Penicillium paradoxum TaxID=176176 RepID=UPI002547E388|nr:uncharacterized protein N7457_007894 [Penicillium paradoxum]KAJ5772998.1 hypothetical protein N7457_007894 [Penicillium paradoxum]
MDYDANYANNTYQAGDMSPNPNKGHGYSPSPPYSSYHEMDHLNMRQPQVPQTGSPASDLNAEPYIYPQPQRPSSTNTGNFDDAVNSAVHNSGPTGYLTPEVLSQITATVIQQLKTTGLDNLQGSSAPPPRSQSQQPSWQTDSYLQGLVNQSPPIEPPQRSSSIPPPSSFSDNTHAGSFPPYVPSGFASDGPPDLKPTPCPSADTASVGSSSFSSQSSEHSQYSSHKPERPRPPDREATVVEMTTFERYWGKLFEDGKATKRLGQFLRGIAVHLIEDYPPGNTIVIPPYKMQKFYRDTHCPNDPYLWQDIFDDKTSSLSRLFREISVEHHLIQNDLKARPDTPGLTPKGFETWATLLILANPEREYQRLQKAVRDMPINNPDDRKERFPKEIPRRLFPQISNIEIREDLENRMMVHCGVDMPYITDEERNQASRPGRSSTSTASPTERTHSYERGRPRPPAPSSPSTRTKPRPVSMVTDDEEEEPIRSVPIERERKPYSANPGGGKVYDESGSSRTHAASISTSRPSDSAYKDNDPPIHRMSESYDRGSHYPRSGSGASLDQRLPHNFRTASRNMNSPGEYRRSENDILGRDAPRYAGLSAHDLHYTESPTFNRSDDDGRRYRRGSHDSWVDDDYYRGVGPGHGFDKYYG